MNRPERLRAAFTWCRRVVEAERAERVTAAYAGSEGQPIVIRRATALREVLTKAPIYILPDELLVGSISSHPDGIPIYPEYSSGWIAQGLSAGLECTDGLDAGTLARLQEALEYWSGRTLEDRARRLFDSEVDRALEAGAFLHSTGVDGLGRIIPGYAVVVDHGLTSVIERIDSLLPHATGEEASMLQACKLAARSVIAWASRYAALARELARVQVKASRNRELEKIAQVCTRVPAWGARSFHEAVQSLLFLHLAVQIESNGHGIGLGRVDQYLYPYYERDVRAGVLTRDEAIELLECLWLKLAEIPKLRKAGLHRMAREGGVSGTMFQNLTIGGTTATGEDASNELSWLILESMRRIRVVQPTISLRYHPGVSGRLLDKAVELIATGIGMPALFNDSTSSHMLAQVGVPVADAWDYSIVGCIYPTMAGMLAHDASPGVFNMAKCLELTLNNGRDPVTGRQVGITTGNVEDFTTFDSLLRAFHDQMSHLLSLMVRPWGGVLEVYREYAPLPLLSCLVCDCIERRADVCAGGARYHAFRLPATGNVNVADGLAAVRKVVFEDRIISMRDLAGVLASDFAGSNEVQGILAQVPKYGNDDQYVDAIAAETAKMFCNEVRKHRDPFGGTYVPVLGVANWHWAAGSLTGALPDGRRKGLPLADGGVSACYGRDRRGPTCLIRSATTVDHYMTGGTLLNLKFEPSVFDDPETIQKFLALLGGFFELGGHHCQFNVISAEELREAQKKPEQYRHLIVRVAGYSAHFVQLSKTVQDEIIARTTYCVR